MNNTKIEDYLPFFTKRDLESHKDDNNLVWQIIRFHVANFELINKAKGSESKHQAWEGGYRDHVELCIEIADRMYRILKQTFNFWDIFVVLYLHDIEKIWKYTTGEIVDKEKILEKFSLTDEQRIAIKYIHGEGNDYCKERKMNELGALCHAADVLSSRLFWDKKTIG